MTLIEEVKAYRMEHRCTLQAAMDAVKAKHGVPEATPWAEQMTDPQSELGQVEQMITSVFRRMPDMSGDNRRRLLRHEYQSVQDTAREIMAYLRP